MNKISTCCKATYIENFNSDTRTNHYLCVKCLKPCILEDAPAEGWEDRFRKQFCYQESKDEHYMVAHYDDEEGFEYWNDYKIINFIKSELELRDRELIEKIIEYRDSLPQFGENGELDKYFNAQVNSSENIIRLIKNK